MVLSLEQIEKISLQVIKTIYLRLDKFPEDTSTNRNAPFHEAFLNAFSDKLKGKVSDIPLLISFSSWLHGLNTTLGSSFFENIACFLSNGQKREYTSKKKGYLKVTKDQKLKIVQIITKLSNSEVQPNLEEENKQIFRTIGNINVNAIDFSADVFIEKPDKIIAIELKSVRPNSGEMRGEKHKILEGKAALYNLFKKKDIIFYIGFPFDPTNELQNPTGYNKTRFLDSIINMKKYFAEDEVLIADELWDFLSGEPNTMKKLIEIINNISTPDFLDRLNFICDHKNYQENKELYVTYLKDWYLNSELHLIENDNTILDLISKNKTMNKIYNQPIFKIYKSKGEVKNIIYNIKRYINLKKLVSGKKENLDKFIKGTQ